MEYNPSEKINERLAVKKPTKNAASILVLIAALGLWVVQILALLMPRESETLLVALVNLSYYLPFVVLPMAICAIRQRGLYEGLRLNAPPISSVISVCFLGVISTFFASTLTVIWDALLGILGLNAEGATIIPHSRSELTAHIFLSAAMPALCEEMLFRGWVLSAWENNGTRRAIWVSAALFALMHGNIYGLPAYVFVGLMAGYLTFALDSVYAGIAFHTVYNTACLVINYVAANASAMGDTGTAVSFLTYLVSLAAELFLGLLIILMTMGILKIRRILKGIVAIPDRPAQLTRVEIAWLILAIIPLLGLLILA